MMGGCDGATEDDAAEDGTVSMTMSSNSYESDSPSNSVSVSISIRSLLSMACLLSLALSTNTTDSSESDSMAISIYALGRSDSKSGARTRARTQATVCVILSYYVLFYSSLFQAWAEPRRAGGHPPLRSFFFARWWRHFGRVVYNVGAGSRLCSRLFPATLANTPSTSTPPELTPG